MSKVKKYELSRRQYISIRNGNKKSYGGNQEWFPKEDAHLKDKLTHQYGCGVIAITDLFLYWAITLPNGKDTVAASYINERNTITKENYMEFVQQIRDQYAFIFGSAGTFAPQLTLAINQYAKENNIQYKAILDMDLNDLTMLNQIKQMLENNQPIILMIGHSFPTILSRLRKKGIPFYKRTKVVDPFLTKPNEPYANYRVLKQGVFGHFVTITGIFIDDKANTTSQDIMLRISSWGVEYYVSYHHLRQYINELSKRYLTGIISIVQIEDTAF